jgi:hypothetical protein
VKIATNLIVSGSHPNVEEPDWRKDHGWTLPSSDPFERFDYARKVAGKDDKFNAAGEEDGLLEDPLGRPCLVQEGRIVCSDLLHRVAGVAVVRWYVHLRERLPRLVAQEHPHGEEAGIGCP